VVSYNRGINAGGMLEARLECARGRGLGKLSAPELRPS
jgi:hypothetical protein